MEILPKYFYTDRKECRRIRGFLKYTDPALKEQIAPAGQIDLCSVQIWNGPALQQTCKPPKGKKCEILNRETHDKVVKLGKSAPLF